MPSGAGKRIGAGTVLSFQTRDKKEGNSITQAFALMSDALETWHKPPAPAPAVSEGVPPATVREVLAYQEEDL